MTIRLNTLTGFAVAAHPATRLKFSRMLRKAGEPRSSYTQLEYHLAVELRKPAYAFLTADGLPYFPLARSIIELAMSTPEAGDLLLATVLRRIIWRMGWLEQ